MLRTHSYKWKATTLEGFIQQLAVAYVARNYFFYVSGHVPTRRSAAEHDERMLAKFDVAHSKWSRYRRRQQRGPDGLQKPHDFANPIHRRMEGSSIWASAVEGFLLRCDTPKRITWQA